MQQFDSNTFEHDYFITILHQFKNELQVYQDDSHRTIDKYAGQITAYMNGKLSGCRAARLCDSIAAHPSHYPERINNMTAITENTTLKELFRAVHDEPDVNKAASLAIQMNVAALRTVVATLDDMLVEIGANSNNIVAAASMNTDAAHLSDPDAVAAVTSIIAVE